MEGGTGGEVQINKGDREGLDRQREKKIEVKS